MNTEAEKQRLNELSRKVIGLCIEIHRELGPGLLESAYEECLAYELSKAGLQFERQRALPVRYKEVQLDCGYRLACWSISMCQYLQKELSGSCAVIYLRMRMVNVALVNRMHSLLCASVPL